jgi:hypothetical protein
MPNFDTTNERRILLGDCGYRISLESDIEQAKSVGGRGNSAYTFLSKAVRCLLNGLDEPASQLLSKAQQWVTVAIADDEIPEQFLNDERYSLEGDRALRYRTLALTNWLLDERHDAESYAQFVKHEDRFLASSEAGKDKANISLTLPTYVDAQVYRRALQIFMSSGMSVPKSHTSIRNDGQMAYILCRHRLGEEFADTETALASRNFLVKNMDNWLARGHFAQAAEWMKIVYWRSGTAGLSAKAALLKCYDHLPHCTRPF